MRSPTKYEKLFSILLFIGSLVLSFAVFLIPIKPEQLSVLGYGGIFLITLLGAMTLFVSAPTMIAAFLIGSTLNPLLVGLVAGLGSALGETTGYTAGYATRNLIADPQEKMTWYWRIFNWMIKYPFLTLFLFSAIPNFITDVSGLIAGRIRYSYPKFLLATFLGKTIRFGLGAFLGAYFGNFILRR
ncbi:MAG TPA: VTT domain-containing protein [Anaerolineales bacterium]